MENSRDSSPDPLSLAMSPPTSHAYASNKSQSRSRSRSRSPSKPLAARSSNVFVTPSKQIVMDTAKRDNLSPWRIKVTVEAEPRDQSPTPARRPRTTTVPLKGSSSPAKKPARRTPGPGAEQEAKVPARKRKGTPIRRTPKAQPPPMITTEATTDEDHLLSDRGTLHHSPTQHVSGRKKRQSLPKMSTGRYGRLSQARDELDQALQAALGGREAAGSPADTHATSDACTGDEVAGDLTVSMNEDFTMVSVESLESYRKHALKNTRMDAKPVTNDTETILEEDESNPTALPSSPPPKTSMNYPDISDKAEKTNLDAAHVTDYDVMSWKPTGPLRTYESIQQSSSNKISDEPTEWRLEREAVSRQIQNANPSEVIVIEDTTLGASQSPDTDDEDGDIWQEEASRSMEEEEHPAATQAEPRRSATLDDFFADQPLKPLRPKIPRTWRRTSGADFSYVDSPEHPSKRSVEQVDSATERKISASGSGADDGVLTPPTTDDEIAKNGEQSHEEDSSELTEPDAAATQLQTEPARVPQWKADFSPLLQHRRINKAKEHAPSPLAPSRSSPEEVASPDGEDTGYFWQRNMPNVYNRPPRPRPKRKSAMDLSELLDLKSSPEKTKSAHGVTSEHQTSVRVETTSSALSARVPVGQVSLPHHSTDNRLINTPLRKSLLKSSKLGSPVVPTQGLKASSSVIEDNSFESKTSDQRQLLNEVNAPSRMISSSPSTFYDTEEHSVSRVSGFSAPEEESSLQEDDLSYESGQFRSYEENLNLDSPTKIKVKFNDSTVESSALTASKHYPSLFGSADETTSSTRSLQHSPGTLTLAAKRETQPGIFSRLSSTFWQAVIRPTGPAEIIPPPTDPEPEYSPRLRASIRRRYGVVSSVHPWTMVHMRTLHRMENSRTSGKSDSIIPKKGALPSFLRPLVGTRQKSVADYEFTLCAERAHVVVAMLQTLVDPELVRAMESGDIDFLGDESARSYRETDPVGRKGGDSPYEGCGLFQPAPGRPIDGWFIMRALGDVVRANETGERL